jgi:hypothetical protein
MYQARRGDEHTVFRHRLIPDAIVGEYRVGGGRGDVFFVFVLVLKGMKRGPE